MGIKIENQYGPGNLADDMFRSFLRANANAAIAMKEDEHQYFANLSALIEQSASYDGSTLDGTTDGMTDWQYAAYELGEAASIYCNGDMANCYDDAMGEPQGQLVGILNNTFKKNKQIWDNTQDWIDKFAGEDGWADSVDKLQKTAGGKEATQGALEILTEIANFHKEKDGAFREHVLSQQGKAVKELNQSLEQAITLGMFDQSPGDPELNYMQAPFSQSVLDMFGYDPALVDKNTNPFGLADPAGFQEYLNEYSKEAQLTIAVEKFKMGDVEGSEAAHKKYLADIDKRQADMMAELAEEEEARQASVADALAKKEATILQYNEDVDTQLAILESLQLNLSGDKNGFIYASEFRNSLQSYLDNTAFKKGAINEKTLPGFKRQLARNLAQWMDEYSMGNTYNNWIHEFNTVSAINDGKDDDDKIAQGDLNVMAVDAFFGGMTNAQVSTMVEGELMPLLPRWAGGGLGMNFPGRNKEERKAEEYMLQTFKVWNLLHQMQNDPAIQTNIGTGTSYVNPLDPAGLLTLNKGQYINTMPTDSTKVTLPDSTNVDIPPIILSQIDSMLTQQTDTSFRLTYDPTNTQQSAIFRGMNYFKDPDRVKEHRDMIINHLAKDSTIARPEAVWHKTYTDYLDSVDVYIDLSDYLKSVE